ncbi:unnamed protein product [Bemisia tabaci]|uniref:Protein JTB n=1 Tax=Bemisia tabaci TaxID=7038 RepID=A0A9P0A4F4_BEMTA|nr:PREDICTED: protein JTB-like [Bemisia tabaci]CAH0384302.1 unnamed protein product [Bemisia tabaci]
MKNARTKVMIESCSSKYMLIIIVIFGGIMYLTLIYESEWTSNHQIGPELPEKNLSTPVEFCWRNEEYKIVEPCKPCTDFEMRSHSVPACDQTLYREVVKCLVSKHEVYRSCGNEKWLKEAQFWKFEVWMLLMSIVSSIFVFLRQKFLDRQMIQKIQRQLACNV